MHIWDFKNILFIYFVKWRNIELKVIFAFLFLLVLYTYIYIHTFINKNSYNYIILKKFIEFLYLFIQAKD